MSWNTRANGNGRSYNDKEVVKDLGTEGIVKLYAQWEDITGPEITEIKQNTINIDKNKAVIIQIAINQVILL